jgi:hypothetical protein
MTIKDENKIGIPRELTFTCSECGHWELAECSRGYVLRRFVEAVVCQRTSGDKQYAGKSIQQCEARYASHADGSEDYDVAGDDYGVTGSQWYACGNCETVLESEDGSPVEDVEELAEWLIENCPQEAPDEASLEREDSED